TVTVDLYIWDGRWIKKELWQIPDITETDFDEAEIELSQGLFIYRIHSATQHLQLVKAAHRRSLPAAADAWHTMETTFTVPSGWYHNLPKRIFAGENFVGFVDVVGSAFHVWKIVNDEWVQDDIEILDTVK